MEIAYTGQTYYDIDLAGRTERLIIAPVHPTLHIASFVLLGDTELTNYCAKVLADKIKDVDYDYNEPDIQDFPPIHPAASAYDRTADLLLCIHADLDRKSTRLNSSHR